MPKSVAIIGAGPAGLMAADILAAHGMSVTVYDHMPSVGRKFLMAGRGGLNITHSDALPDFLSRYGDAAEWLTSAITDFSPKDLTDWCAQLGQETFVGSSGRIFPRTLKASPLLRALISRLSAHGVAIKTRHRWTGWTDTGALSFSAPDGQHSSHPDYTIFALGGASWSRLGSDGSWHQILSRRGIDITPFKPANSGFKVDWSDSFKSRFAGQPLKNISVTFAGTTGRGEAMLTSYGIEGGVIYALSSDLRNHIDRDGSAKIEIDLRPEQDIETLRKKLERVKPAQSLNNRLRKAFNLPPVAINLLREGSDLSDLPAAVKSVKIRLTAMQSLDRAISTAGGIMRHEVDESFMLKKLPNSYAVGEMLDWEAPTGGYLLQASFATAVAAARAILAKDQSSVVSA